MIFHKSLIPRIFKGQKTETRRLASPVDHLTVLPGGRRVVWSRRGASHERYDKYTEGDYKAVQPGRGQPGDPRGAILIRRVRGERLQDITAKGIRAEGFGTRRDFIDLWNSLHGEDESWSNNPAVWVLVFEVIPFKNLPKRRR
jgi:uncharacterized protein YhfF